MNKSVESDSNNPGDRGPQTCRRNKLGIANLQLYLLQNAKKPGIGSTPLPATGAPPTK